MIRKWICWLVFILFPFLGICQITVDSVMIVATHPTPFGLENDKSKTLDSTVHDLLTSLPSKLQGIIQQNTPGGIATYLHRGMGAKHLAILWQGINIQSVTNGTFDLNLIPEFLFSNIRFFDDNTSVLLSNNSLSGTLDLGTTYINKPKVVLRTQYNSLQNYSLDLLTHLKSKKLHQTTGLSISYDHNRFKYQDGAVTKERMSTHFRNIHFISQTKLFINKKSTLSADIWINEAARDILPSITVVTNKQTQNDFNLRTNIKYSTYTHANHFSFHMGYMNEKLDFRTIIVDSRSEVDVFTASFDLTDLNDRSYFLSFKMRHDIASPNFYVDSKKRTTLGISGSKILQLGKSIKMQTTLRQDVVDKNIMPTTASIKMMYKNTILNLAKNYQLPGFNDLFWPTGGNQNLKIENGFAGDITGKIDFMNIAFEGTLYSNLVQNWIQWIPQSSGIWTATNQKKVWSRGLDIKAKKEFSIRAHKLTSEIGYFFNRTSALEHYFDKNQIGKQLIYIPVHKVLAATNFSFNKHVLSFQYILTGERPDSPDNKNILSTYHLVDISYQIKIKQFALEAKVLNVFNQQYQIVRFYPSPLRNYSISITHTIN